MKKKITRRKVLTTASGWLAAVPLIGKTDKTAIKGGMTLNNARCGDIVRIHKDDYGTNSYGHYFSDKDKCLFLIIYKDRTTNVKGQDAFPDRIGIVKLDMWSGGMKGNQAQELRGMLRVKCELLGNIEDLL